MMASEFHDNFPKQYADLFVQIFKTDVDIQLSETHHRIIVDILDTCHKSKQGEDSLYANLRGPAGTGKTTLLKYIVLGALQQDLRVLVTSFTHKACGVLREKFEDLEVYGVTPPVPLTLHSLLNLKPKQAIFGEPETFIQKSQPYLGDYDLVIIDECSMLGNNMMNYIEKDIKSQGINVLFAGDHYQLRPVGEVKLSRSFKTDKVYKLTEVVRHTGPILDLATQVRSNKVTSFFREGKTADSEVVVHFSNEAKKKRWLKELKEGDPDKTVMLVFTNANRRSFNTLARTTLFGEDAPRFIKGDTVLSLSPIFSHVRNRYGDFELLYPNNCDISITGEPVLHDYFQPVQGVNTVVSAWELPTTDGTIYVLADHDEELKYKKAVQKIGKQIAEEIEESKNKGHEKVREAKSRWKTQYFPLKEFFADVDFRYALTIHKSQGSTYKNVFVHTDYRQGRDMARELLYVAVTRAAKTLHMVNP